MLIIEQITPTQSVVYSHAMPIDRGWQGFKYVRRQFHNGSLSRADPMTVYCMSRADFARLMARWNKAGNYASHVGQITYQFEEV